MLKWSKYIIFLLGLLLSFSVFSQTKEELKTEKITLEKQIDFTEKKLKTTKSNKKESTSSRDSLDKKIKKQEERLKTLDKKIASITDSILKTDGKREKTAKSILKTEETLQQLKDEYAKMIYACFKRRGNDADLMFIISPEDFNQAHKRTFYIKQYAFFRKKQAEKITKTQRELEEKKDSLNIQKDQLILDSASRGELISAKEDSLRSIKVSRKEKQELINKLANSEKEFKDLLEAKQKRAEALDDEIRKIIEEEIRRAREEAEKKNKGLALTPEAMAALSSKFISNKGKLPWPLAKGVIVQGYGKQKHAVFAGIETFNNGIDISTDKNAIVRAVFDGIISRIFFIKGEGKAILMSHGGEYFSVYSRLKETSVKVGDKLLAKEKIGTVLTQKSEEKSEEKTELHFEIWKGKDKQDPSKWLYKAY